MNTLRWASRKQCPRLIKKKGHVFKSQPVVMKQYYSFLNTSDIKLKTLGTECPVLWVVFAFQLRL